MSVFATGAPAHTLDLRCYFVTGAGADGSIASVPAIAAQAAAGGAGIIQVRSKPISVRDLTALAIEVAAAVHEANPATRVVIDDRVDVAAALMPDHHIHGVHIGQDDLDPRLTRQVLGPDAIIGLTPALSSWSGPPTSTRTSSTTSVPAPSARPPRKPLAARRWVWTAIPRSSRPLPCRSWPSVMCSKTMPPLSLPRVSRV